MDKLKFRRTDAWREGKWLDLWSVVHILSGICIGLGFGFLHLAPQTALMLTTMSLIAYEAWEAYVRIEETLTNRFADIIVGFAGFIPALFLLSPLLSRGQLALAFSVILVADIVLSFFGWRASQKAAELQKRMHQRYVMQRTLLKKQQKRLKERFRR